VDRYFKKEVVEINKDDFFLAKFSQKVDKPDVNARSPLMWPFFIS
jgi:hypothetical protein